jgi:hypothetical protein
MVKAVTAFAADDGQVFTTETQAARHDTECALKKLGIFNEATRLAVLENAESIYHALGVYVKALPPKVLAQDTRCVHQLEMDRPAGPCSICGDNG